ncbi:KH domain-containing protein, partial [Acinetobacter baumannii]
GSRLRYTIQVAESDRGRVIGKQGRIVNALRTVAQAAGAKNRVRVQVIVQTEGGSTDEGTEDAE